MDTLETQKHTQVTRRVPVGKVTVRTSSLISLPESLPEHFYTDAARTWEMWTLPPKEFVTVNKPYRTYHLSSGIASSEKIATHMCNILVELLTKPLEGTPEKPWEDGEYESIVYENTTLKNSYVNVIFSDSAELNLRVEQQPWADVPDKIGVLEYYWTIFHTFHMGFQEQFTSFLIDGVSPTFLGAKLAAEKFYKLYKEEFNNEML
jgi:hypothetical protein